MNTTPASGAAPAAPNPRRRRLLILAVVLLLVFGGYGLWWFVHGRWYVSTDDAYVSSDIVQISASVGGTVLSVAVDDTQHVERGQLLVQLDPADAQLALAGAEAELGRTVRQVRALFAQADGLRAQQREREVALRGAQSDLKRREAVSADGAISAEELTHARDLVAQLNASLSATREQLASTTAQIDHTDVAHHPQVLAAAARVREAALALQRTRIVAPVSGVIARRGVQIGARINAGTPLMAVVPLEQAWVDANFKEVQLKDVRVGQPVRLHADYYGSGVDYHGHVAGLAAGSGSAFALLPAQNASGNWIKIVQRLPVRIALDEKQLAEHPLRVGLSMLVEIDVHDQSGSTLARQLRSSAAPQAQAAAQNDAQVEQQIQAIIAANSGRSGA